MNDKQPTAEVGSIPCNEYEQCPFCEGQLEASFLRGRAVKWYCDNPECQLSREGAEVGILDKNLEKINDVAHELEVNERAVEIAAKKLYQLTKRCPKKETNSDRKCKDCPMNDLYQLQECWREWLIDEVYRGA